MSAIGLGTSSDVDDDSFMRLNNDRRGWVLSYPADWEMYLSQLVRESGQGDTLWERHRVPARRKEM